MTAGTLDLARHVLGMVQPQYTRPTEFLHPLPYNNRLIVEVDFPVVLSNMENKQSGQGDTEYYFILSDQKGLTEQKPEKGRDRVTFGRKISRQREEQVQRP
jgi:hypothetical protein